MRTPASIFVFAIVTVWTASPHAQTEGIKETERFIKSGESTVGAIHEGRADTQGALDAYNGLVMGTSKDSSLKDDYKRLLKTQKTMTDKVAEARKDIADMDKQAASYFSVRADQIGHIEDQSLRDKARSRLDENRKHYDDVRAEIKKAGDELAPFSKDITDHIKYLGAELNPGAIASLKPEAEKLNGRGATLFAQVDKATDAATRYFNSLRSE